MASYSPHASSYIVFYSHCSYVYLPLVYRDNEYTYSTNCLLESATHALCSTMHLHFKLAEQVYT